MPGRISRRVTGILLAIAAILLAIFLPPLVNVNRYRNEVASAIGQAVGRQVTVSGIELQMMPRPGMVLSGFEVADDPSYGAEPMLHADLVTAYLRLSSLWRGKLEIGTLSLDAPSLNLVRRADGRWNVEDLIERTSHAESAPTAKSSPEARSRFPYVEATGGRINFKLGQVKKAFSFTDADFALWLESENEWGVRLLARPIRSDVAVSETGTLRMEGRFQRASRLRDTPINLTVSYTKGQLGQVTALIYGRDRGWRGAVTSNATLTGTPASLAVTADATVDDFRRYDIALGEALGLAAHCTGTFSAPDDTLRDIQCLSPIRPGLVTIRGNVTGWNAQGYNLGVTAEHVPLGRVVALARHTKKDLPEDLTATGSADIVFSLRREAGGIPAWSGGGNTTRLLLQSTVLKRDLELGPIEFIIIEPQKRHLVGKASIRGEREPMGAVLQVVMKPFAMPLSATSPATASGYFNLDRYRVSLKGDSELTRLLAVARAMGLSGPTVGMAGPAKLDLDISGTWTGFSPPSLEGKVQIHNATVELQGVLEPLHVGTATVSLADQSAAIDSLAAEFAGGPSISGTSSFPVRCMNPEYCTLQFELHIPDLSLTRLNHLLNPEMQSRPWYHLLSLGQRDDYALSKVQAQGHVTVGRLEIANFAITNVSAKLLLRSGALSLKELTGDVLGGHHMGNWDADFTARPPKFFGSGSVSKVAMEQVSSEMRDPWATGALSGDYTLGLSGFDAATLRSSATGSAKFKWTSGSLRHIEFDSKSVPLAFSDFVGRIALRDGTLTCLDCRLEAGRTNYAVTGTATFDRALDVRFGRPGGSCYTISGSLEKPQVQPVTSSTSEAKLR